MVHECKRGALYHWSTLDGWQKSEMSEKLEIAEILECKQPPAVSDYWSCSVQCRYWRQASSTNKFMSAWAALHLRLQYHRPPANATVLKTPRCWAKCSANDKGTATTVLNKVFTPKSSLNCRQPGCFGLYFRMCRAPDVEHIAWLCASGENLGQHRTMCGKGANLGGDTMLRVKIDNPLMKQFERV